MAIDQAQVQKAVDFLRDPEGKAAKARAAHEYQQDMTRVIKARLMMDSDAKSQAAKEADAYAHPDYAQHLETVRLLAEEDYKQRDRRAAAQAVIDLWRTEQSNARTMGRLG